jgi:hypothetical protein
MYIAVHTLSLKATPQDAQPVGSRLSRHSTDCACKQRLIRESGFCLSLVEDRTSYKSDLVRAGARKREQSPMPGAFPLLLKSGPILLEELALRGIVQEDKLTFLVKSGDNHVVEWTH